MAMEEKDAAAAALEAECAALRSAGPGLCICIARHVVQLIWIPRLSCQTASYSYDVASNSCQALALGAGGSGAAAQGGGRAGSGGGGGGIRRACRSGACQTMPATSSDRIVSKPLSLEINGIL
jgi:hypothetical protein